jgi:capsular exopolysaccharide synthesis family protein
MGQHMLENEREFHVQDYLKVILRRKWIVLAFFVIVVVTVAINSFSARPAYEATCQVLVERQTPHVANIKEVVTVDAWWLDYYQTQCEIIKSKRIAQAVIDQLDLEHDLAFNPALQRKRFSLNLSPKKAMATMVKGINNILESSPPRDQDILQPRRETGLLGTYLGMLDVEHIEDSRLINVSFVTRNPELSARLANAHAKQYIQQSLEMKFATTKDAVAWLNQKIKEAKVNLRESEEGLQHYKEAHDLVSLDLGDASNIVVQKLNDLNSSLTEAKTARIEKENLYRELQRISSKPDLIESIPTVANNEFIQELKAQYFALAGAYSELSQKYGPQHPQMKQLRSQVHEIDRKLGQEIRKITKSIQTEYEIARAKEDALVKALEEQKKEALKLNQKQIQYVVLKREVDTNRSVYESLLSRLKEASLAEELKVTNISIVDLARVPTGPVGPSKSKNLMIAIVVGLMGGIGLAFFFEYLDGSIKSSEDVERYLGLAFLGHVQHLGTDDIEQHYGKLPVVAKPGAPTAEEYRTIATNIIYSIPDKPRKVILITSATAEEGKTMVAGNLAAVLAQMGKRVLLIDADLRRPRVHALFRLPRKPGLSDFLAQSTETASVFRRGPVQGMYIVSAGKASPNPSDLLHSRKMRAFLEGIRAKVDFIILDAPPVVTLSDPLALAPIVDGIVLVVRSGITPRPTVNKARKQIDQIHGKFIGAVLNDHDVKRERYYHYYRDGYHRYYDEEHTGRRGARI